MIPGQLSTKLIGDFPKRAAYAREHGVKVGTAASQSAALAAFIDQQVAGDAKDLGVGYLPAGLIRLDTTVTLSVVRSAVIRGTGCARNNATGASPRKHGNVEQAGTYLYWGGGSSASPMLDLAGAAHIHWEDMALYLEPTVASGAAAAIGVKFTRVVGQGTSGHYFENVVVSSLTQGVGTGFKYGDAVGDFSNDTSLFVNCEHNLLAIGHHHVNDQSVEFTHICPRFRAVDTFFKFDEGGALHVYGLQGQDDVAGHDAVIVYVGHGTRNAGTFNVYGGYIDRQGDSQYYTLFELGPDTINTQCYASGFRLNPMSSGGFVMDGTERAFIEARPGTQVLLDSCMCDDQSIVRWRNSFAAQNAALDRDAIITFRGGFVADRLFGSELVTTLEGGYAGTVRFEGVRLNSGNGTRIEDVWVNEFPIAGSSRTFRDPDDFDDVEVGSGNWSSTWLGGGKASSPAWQGNLVAYYPLNEAIGATSLVDRVNHATLGPANDLTVGGSVQVPNPPLPYLDQWSDWSLNVDHGEDTGINIDPSATSLTIFCFLQPKAIATGARVANLAGSVGNFQILRDPGTLFLVCGRSVTDNMFKASTKSPSFVVVTIAAGGHVSADTCKLFVNGVKFREVAVDYSTSGAGNLWIGGGNATGRWNGYLSRVGVILDYLTDKEATILSNQASVIARRQKRRARTID